MPPTIDGDSTGQVVESDPTSSVGSSSVLDPSPQSFPMPQSFRESGRPAIGSISPYNDGIGAFQQFPQTHHSQPNIYGTPQHQTYQPQVFPGSQGQSLGTSENDFSVENDQSTAENLSEVLGELKIDETGIGMVF